MFFKKHKMEYDLLYTKYQELSEKELLQSKELIELRKLKGMEKELIFLQDLLKRYTIMGLEKNKFDEEYYVCLFASESSFDLYLKNPNRHHPFPRLYGTIYTRSSTNSIARCKIEDMFAEDKHAGNGTILLNYAKKYLKSIGVRCIYGELSFVDKDNFDVLEKFYKYNDFKVTFNEERTSGSIEITF